MTKWSRIAYVVLVTGVLAACSGVSANTSPNRGSVHLADAHQPEGVVGEITFSGAVNDTSRTAHEACAAGGSTYRYFTLTASGMAAGRQYFLSISIYPYDGPDAYDLQPMPPAILDYASSPNPFVDQSPFAYPGFLNFAPKSDPGNAFASPQKASGGAMAVDRGEQTGWIDLRMVSVNQITGPHVQLELIGRFACGPAFQV